MSEAAIEDQVSLLSVESRKPAPDTVTKIIKRVRALTLTLLPLEADPDTLTDPTSRIITPKVIGAYSKAAGDYTECLPYCLLRARQTFMWDANSNPADYDENLGRAIACEVLARRIVHAMPEERLNEVMSGRFRFKELDGDTSSISSALETAIDQHCTIFLSSNEAQAIVNALWRGEWVQKNNDNNDIDYVEFKPARNRGFWDHLDPSRLSVPRYQNWFRILIWLFFLFAYSMTVQQPLEMTLDPRHPFDAWEYVLYIFALAFTVEEIHRIFTTLRYFNWRALTFWNAVSVVTYTLMIAAFVLRVTGLTESDVDHAATLKLRSFQTLSCVAPLIWLRLITVVDGFKYIGTMQICVGRMIKESGIFFVLLALIGAGFAQAMYALDASDGQTENGSLVVNNLIQGLLGSPDFGNAGNALNLSIFYLWNIFTTILLLNILISLFSSAYDDITGDAEAHFLAFFAGKTVGMIRAPDSFVYPAPFNLLEIVLVAPFELFLSRETYGKLNRYVMSFIFFVPLTIIAVFEAYLDPTKNLYMKNLFNHIIEGEEDDPTIRNPTVEDEGGLEISRVSFEELVESFPNSYQSAEATILTEIHSLTNKVETLTKLIEEMKASRT